MTAEIQERLNHHSTASNGGDAAAAAEAWTDDAKQFAPAAPPSVGRDAIRDGIRAIQQMNAQLELRSTDVLVEGDMAIDRDLVGQTTSSPMRSSGMPDDAPADPVGR